ncbi:hypothetical protein GCM10008938_23110 [Deinococcus roseus]|uniref:Uncharacterized protein n=1 Tax=Deinococcus roseus TaxID=392414 RepID=A0ABQ2D1U4_9DEIO|nr:hypothetical protein GCM10008938_23110 [Deinococcus roseus]
MNRKMKIASWTLGLILLAGLTHVIVHSNFLELLKRMHGS